MRIPSHGLFGRQTKHVPGCTTRRESTAAPDHVKFKSGIQEAEHTGRFLGLHCHVFLHYRYLRLQGIGENSCCGMRTTLKAWPGSLPTASPEGLSWTGFCRGNAEPSRMAQRPGHPAARHPRGSGGKQPGGGGRAVCSNGSGAGAGAGAERPGRVGSGRAGPGGVVQGLESEDEDPCGAGTVPQSCSRAALPRRSAGAWLGTAAAGGPDPAEGPGRQPALTGSLPGRALPGAPRSPLPPPHLLLASVRKLAAWPRGAPATPRGSPPATPASGG